MNMVQQGAQWVPLSEAAKTVSTSVSKLSRLVREKKLHSKKDVRDERVTLVDLNEVKAYFGME